MKFYDTCEIRCYFQINLLLSFNVSIKQDIYLYTKLLGVLVLSCVESINVIAFLSVHFKINFKKDDCPVSLRLSGVGTTLDTSGGEVAALSRRYVQSVLFSNARNATNQSANHSADTR